MLLCFDLVYCMQVTVNFGPHFKFPPKDQPQYRPVCTVMSANNVGTQLVLIIS